MGTFKGEGAKAMMNYWVMCHSVVWVDRRCLLILSPSRKWASVSVSVWWPSLLFCFLFINMKVPSLFHLRSTWQKYLKELGKCTDASLSACVAGLHLILWVLYVPAESFLPYIIFYWSASMVQNTFSISTFYSRFFNPVRVSYWFSLKWDIRVATGN